MKFTLLQSDLDKQLQYVGRVVVNRASMPVLSNLLLETDKTMLRISGTDLELAMTTSVPATVTQEGSFTVPAKLFADFIHQNPDSSLEFSLEGTELVCKSEQVTARIPGIDAEEYPALPTIKQDFTVALPAETVIHAMKQVVVSCAQDTGRPVLTGVYVLLSSEKVVFAATDSFRLSERQLAGVAVPQETTLLIPHRTVQEVIRMVSQMGGIEDISIAVSEQQIIIKIGTVEVYSRLLNGVFPKYQSIIPNSYVIQLEVPADELIQALRLTTVFAQSGISNVVLSVSQEGEIGVKSHATQRGGARQVVQSQVQGVIKEPLTTAFNTKFLLDALQSGGKETVELHFSGAESPLVIKTGDMGLTQLVMPIRLDG